MKYLTALLFTLTVLLGAFSEDQHRLLLKAKAAGKPYHLSYSLMAIVWQESSCGIHRANYRSGCYGVGHIRLITYMTRHNIPDTFKNQQAAVRNLMNSDSLNFNEMTLELKYWLKKHKGNHKKTWASYYAGTKWRNGILYANSIKEKIRKLKKLGY